MKRLVLLGGGHAQLAVLRALARARRMTGRDDPGAHFGLQAKEQGVQS